MDEYTLTVHPFEMGTDKEAALKPLEEAAEVYAAWQQVDEYDGYDVGENLAEEISDCIQACCNLAARYNINLDLAIWQVEEKNRERSRYEQAQPEMTEGAKEILDRLIAGADDVESQLTCHLVIRSESDKRWPALYQCDQCNEHVSVVSPYEVKYCPSCGRRVIE